MDEFVERAYIEGLLKEGLPLEVVTLLQELAEINDRSITYFVMGALEDFFISLSQEFAPFTENLPPVH